MSTSDHSRAPPAGELSPAALADALRSAAEQVANLETEIDDRGAEELERLAEATTEADRLMDRYEERATDWDDFAGFVEFQNTFVEFVEGLAPEFPHREAFEAADEQFKKQRLDAADFEAAREALAPARQAAGLLEERARARERFGDLRYAAKSRRDSLAERCESLERLLALSATDLDVAHDELRARVETYNRAVRAAFDELRADRPARELFDVVSEAAGRPLVGFETPPAELVEYLGRAETGTESLATLVTYASYSPQKLEHYVEAPQRLKHHVGGHRTYLDRLDAGPLTVAWPPPPATTLEFRAREIRAVLSGFAPEETIAELRRLREFARDGARYGDCREAAYVLAELGPEDRDRLESGDAARELVDARASRDRLAEALAAVS
jgi:hypothetical protein